MPSSQPHQNLFCGLTLFVFTGMSLLSSGSAVSGFPCSKPPLSPILQASSIKWGLFFIIPPTKQIVKSFDKFKLFPPQQKKVSGNIKMKQELIDILDRKTFK
jgi:hypothetical protein